MNIENKKRPWEKQSSYGTRLKRDPFYQSTTWKNTKTGFKEGYTVVNGYRLSNRYCIDCYIERGDKNPGSNEHPNATDHIRRIEDGGSRTAHSNLATRCESHHNRKSAIEGNNARKRA